MEAVLSKANYDFALEERPLKPLSHQVSLVFFEPGGAIERLRALVSPANFKSQRLNAGFPAQVFRKGDHCLAQLLPAEWLAQIQFIEQGKAPVEFQAEAKRKREISSQFRATENQINLRQTRVFQSSVHGMRRCWFVELHVLLRIELAHHLQQRWNFLVREKLEQHIHNRDSKPIGIGRDSVWL